MIVLLLVARVVLCCGSLCVGSGSLLVACRSLFVAHRVLCVVCVCCMLCVMRCLRCVGCFCSCSLRDGRCFLFGVLFCVLCVVGWWLVCFLCLA